MFAYGHEHDRRLIVSGHQYGGCDVMWNALYQWQSHSLVKKEALCESRQVFEVAEAQITGLVNLVFYLQTGFTSARILYW